MPSIEMKPVLHSSNVKARGYDIETQTLHIEFVNGSTYEYDDVPPDVVAAFDNAKSKGAFPRTHLKGYAYRKL